MKKIQTNENIMHIQYVLYHMYGPEFLWHTGLKQQGSDSGLSK